MGNLVSASLIISAPTHVIQPHGIESEGLKAYPTWSLGLKFSTLKDEELEVLVKDPLCLCTVMSCL